MHCDGVAVADIARATGTPIYIYSAAAIRSAFAALDSAFAGTRHTLHYALKANSTLAVLRLLRSLGAQADANSGGEIDVALRAGFEPSQIVFTGVGKTRDELDRAVALGVKAINIESEGEAARIDALARSRGVKARVALRVNPDIDANTHAHISTGRRFNKFGVPIDLGLERVGVHDNFFFDLGGGLGISYEGEPGPDPADYAAAVMPIVSATGLDLLLEPGRFLIARAGILVGEVADIKAFEGSPRFIVLDTGMTELIRPALYGAFHRISAVTPRPGPEQLCEVVGPLCETSDTLGHERAFGPVEVGDRLAVHDAGAYGIVMASNYNRRPFGAEVLVEDGAWRIIRRRQTYEDLVQYEE